MARKRTSPGATASSAKRSAVGTSSTPERQTSVVEPTDASGDGLIAPRTPKRTSWLWKFFTELDPNVPDKEGVYHENHAMCHECFKAISLGENRKNLKGMDSHLLTHGKSLYDLLKDENANHTLASAKKLVLQRNTQREILTGRDIEAQRLRKRAIWRFETLLWIIETNQSFSSVDNKAFRRFIRATNPKVKFFSRKTLDRLIDVYFDHYMEKIRDLLASIPGRISFTTDIWTSPASDPFMAVTGHWIEKGKSMSCLIDFVSFHEDHDGKGIAAALYRVLEKFGLTDKVCGITTDNATNNIAAMKALGDVQGLPGFLAGTKFDHKEQHFRYAPQ